MNGEFRKALIIVLDFVEDNNKQDKNKELAESARFLKEKLLDLLD